MESFEFDESQLGELNKVALKLFEDENDPRSTSYKRVIIRPKIKWHTFVSWFFCPILCILASFYLLRIFDIVPNCYYWITVAVCTLIYLICTANWLVVFGIKVYQRYAPTEIRMKCRFEPSCSEYMIAVIEKYGLIRGVKRGFNRLNRCNVRGGGFDEP